MSDVIRPLNRPDVENLITVLRSLFSLPMTKPMQRLQPKYIEENVRQVLIGGLAHLRTLQPSPELATEIDRLIRLAQEPGPAPKEKFSP